MSPNTDPPTDGLMKTIDEKLIAMLTPGLKAVIDRLWARGLSYRAIQTLIDANVQKAKTPGTQEGELVKLQVAAYLASKKEKQ